jgi:hypothetical protein
MEMKLLMLNHYAKPKQLKILSLQIVKLSEEELNVIIT